MRDRQPYPLDHASHMPVLIGIAAKFRIRRVLELGAGSYSTPLFLNRQIFPDLVELVSVEKDTEWMERLYTIVGDSRITITKDNVTDDDRFDLIFVDNAYAPFRVQAIADLAAKPLLKAIVIVHDSENPLYHAEIEKFRYLQDFKAFDPETCVAWKFGPDLDLLVSPVVNALAKTIEEHSDLRPDDIPAWDAVFKERNTKMLRTSVVMTAFERAPLLRSTFLTYREQTRKPDEIIVIEDGMTDAGATQQVCVEANAWGLPVQHFYRKNRPNIGYSNSAIPKNIGIKMATGDIVILQNAEVRFTKPTDFANIVAPTEADPTISCCAPCLSLQEDGSPGIWYADPNLWNYNHFCQAYRRDRIIAIGGFDENFRGYGYEDNDFNWRMEVSGVVYQWAKDVVTEHQWHPGHPDPKDPENEKFNIDYGSKQVYGYHQNKTRGLESNVGKAWGDPSS